MARLAKISSFMLLVASLAQAQLSLPFAFFQQGAAAGPLGFRYKSCVMGTSVTAVDNMMVSFTIDTTGTYLIRAFGVSDNTNLTIDSCYILSNNLGSKKSYTAINTIGALADYEIRDTLTAGTYYVRYKWSGTADLAAGIALYRGPATPASAGDDTTSAVGVTASFTPTSAAGDSLLMAVNGYCFTSTPAAGVTEIGTVNYYSGSRKLKIFQMTSAGNSQIREDFDSGPFNSTVTVIKKP